MTPYRRLLLGLGSVALAVPAAVANPPGLPLPPPTAIDCPPEPCPTVGIPCLPAPCRTPRVIVEQSPPEVRFVAPRTGTAGGSPPTSLLGGQADCGSKSCSFLNLNISRTRNRLVGGGLGGIPQPVTTVVPAYATATIPIAVQTTQFVGGAEFGALGVRREAVGLTAAEAAELIREAVRRETAARPESAPAAGPSCAELKIRVDRIELRLEQIEKKVESIAAKLGKTP